MAALCSLTSRLGKLVILVKLLVCFSHAKYIIILYYIIYIILVRCVAGLLFSSVLKGSKISFLNSWALERFTKERTIVLQSRVTISKLQQE